MHVSERHPPPVLQFYLTSPYTCTYLAARMARSQVVVPADAVDTVMYSELVRRGFRRSGEHVYRPRCDSCKACIPVRVAVADFRAGRTQRRCERRNADVQITFRPLAFDEAHYQLYRRYQAGRHAEGCMDQDDREQYRAFVLHSSVNSFLLEYRLDDVVIMVSLVDRLVDGLSAVYTFFDPERRERSLGVLGVLTLIRLATETGLPYVYLGYWIRDCRKMVYKSQYQPLQAWVEGSWCDWLHNE